MQPLSTVSSPPSGRGRPKVAGTVLARPSGEELVLVRQVFAGGEDTGGTGCPAVAVWIAFTAPGERGYSPVLVRRASFGLAVDWPWSELACHEVAAMEAIHDVAGCLRLCGRTVADLLPTTLPHWPTMIWDRRVILPDDRRYPAEKKKPLGEVITAMLRDRQTCLDAHVWRIDGQILAICPRVASE